MTCGVCIVVATAVFSGVSHVFFTASAFESAVAAAGAVAFIDGGTMDGADAGVAVGAAAAVAPIGCMIVVTVDVGVIEVDADCTITFEFTLYKYASYSGSGSVGTQSKKKSQKPMVCKIKSICVFVPVKLCDETGSVGMDKPNPIFDVSAFNKIFATVK